MSDIEKKIQELRADARSRGSYALALGSSSAEVIDSICSIYEDVLRDDAAVEEGLIDQLEGGIRLFGLSKTQSLPSVQRWISGAKDTIEKAREE